MIGREDELRRLTQLVSAPDSGVAILAGEPGIGKTRLVHELLAVLPPHTVVLVGQAEPGSLGRPFELLLSALDGRAGANPAEIDPAEIDLLTDSSRTQVERLRTGLRILLQVTSDRPAVVVFEDLHWADSESIALFERIADLEGERLLVGTYRPAEVIRRNPLAGLLDRLERRHAVYHVRLERLGLAETSAFLAAATGKTPRYRTAVSLHTRTGGNPFFLEELLRASHDVEELCDQPLPWSLAETLRRQVDHLQPGHQRLVEAAAVLGYRIPFDLLASVTGRDENDLIGALRELVAQGVLVETGEDEFAFRHALVREAIGERLLGRERRNLHEAALNALLASGDADLALVAKHARGAGRYDDMLAAVRKGSAAYLAMGSAFQALQLAEMGLDEVPDDPDLLAVAAQAAWLAGLLDDADTYARRWQSHARTPESAVAALSLRVRLAWSAQDLDGMGTLSTELRAALERLPRGVDQAHAMAVLAQSARLRDLDDESLEWAERTVAVVDELGGHIGIRLAALVEKGALLAARAASIEEGRTLLAHVADEAEKAGEWLIAAVALNKLVHLPPSTTWRDLAELLERMRTDAERAGSEAFAVAAYYQGKARLFMQKGNLAKAIDAIERGRAHDLGYRRSMRRSDFHGVFLAGLRLEAGDVAGAAQITADLVGVPGMEIGIPGLEFNIACRRGNVDQARALLPDVISVVQSTGGRDGEFLHDLVSAAVAAPLAVDEIGKLIAGLDGPGVEPSYRRLVAAQLAEAQGNMADALAEYVRATESGGLPPAARATAHVGAARSLIALHRIDEARVHAQRASELLDCWSGWRVRQLDAVRSRLGLNTAGPPSDGGAATLTPREREVAVLITKGMTNSEIARRLYISPRTAAVHVSNILRKLGCSSRTEVAAALSR
jgi:DNA-binding CsgD family transcriptional regulator/tetratricopeptide (TPR) repeat protein